MNKSISSRLDKLEKGTTTKVGDSEKVSDKPDLPSFAVDRLTRKQAAEYIGLSNGTLGVDACTHQLGVPFYRIGWRVFYRRSDLDAWIEARRVDPPLRRKAKFKKLPDECFK